MDSDDNSPPTKRVLIKISGEALTGLGQFGSTGKQNADQRKQNAAVPGRSLHSDPKTYHSLRP